MSRLKRNNGVARLLEQSANRLGPDEGLIDRRQEDVGPRSAECGQQANQGAATGAVGIENRLVFGELSAYDQDLEIGLV